MDLRLPGIETLEQHQEQQLWDAPDGCRPGAVPTAERGGLLAPSRQCRYSGLGPSDGGNDRLRSSAHAATRRVSVASPVTCRRFSC